MGVVYSYRDEKLGFETEGEGCFRLMLEALANLGYALGNHCYCDSKHWFRRLCE